MTDEQGIFGTSKKEQGKSSSPSVDYTHASGQLSVSLDPEHSSLGGPSLPSILVQQRIQLTTATRRQSVPHRQRVVHLHGIVKSKRLHQASDTNKHGRGEFLKRGELRRLGVDLVNELVECDRVGSRNVKRTHGQVECLGFDGIDNGLSGVLQ